MNQDITRYALVGIQAEIVKLETRLAELRDQQAQMLKAVGARKSPDGPATPVKATRKRRGGMSDEGRERIREAQKARWARVCAAQTVNALTPDPELADEPLRAKAAAKRGRTTGGKRVAKESRKKTGTNKK